MPRGPIKVDTSDRLSRNLGLLQAGSMVTLDIATPAGQRAKFKSIFVGYLPKQYVLVQYPDASKMGSFSQHIKQGTSVTVRGLIEGHEGSIVAFASHIKQTLQLPSKLIALAFPKSVSLQQLERHFVSTLTFQLSLILLMNIGLLISLIFQLVAVSYRLIMAIRWLWSKIKTLRLWLKTLTKFLILKLKQIFVRLSLATRALL